jgi:hypothetical protein
MSESNPPRTMSKYESEMGPKPGTGFTLRMYARLFPWVANAGVVLAVLAYLFGISWQVVYLLLAVLMLIFGSMFLQLVLLGLADLIDYARELRDSSIRLDQRLADVAEKLPNVIAPTPPTLDIKAQRLAEIRHAIRNAAWTDAADLVRTFSESHPDDPEPARAALEVAEARETAGRDLSEKLQAARDVNDPDRVIELRDLLKPLLPHDAIRTLDRDLAKWFMALIQRRMRTGKVRADVAVLAGKVASSLDDTPEGASLRASLPTLRRAAGLCPRCAQPYTGIEDACPLCLAGTSLPPPTVAPHGDEENGRFPEILDRPT